MDTDLPAGAESVVICAPDNAGRLIGKSIPAGRWKSVLGKPRPPSTSSTHSRAAI